MTIHKEGAPRKGAMASILTLLTAAMFFTLGTTAWADRDMGGHPSMTMGGHDSGMDKGKGYGMHRPHNAAEYYLKLGQRLKLTEKQTQQLTKLRDDYIEKNATTEDQLKAAYGDIGRTLYADDVDLKAADELFSKIGKMESQLWRAYAQQLHDIKTMLTPEQKKALADLKKSHRKDREEMHGDKPMGHGDMPMGKGMQ